MTPSRRAGGSGQASEVDEIESKPAVASSMRGDASGDIPTEAVFGGWQQLVAGLVAVFALGGDALFASVAIGFTVWQGWLIGFGIGASVAAGLNLAACGWLLPRWDQWVASQGAKFERRLTSLRRSRLLRHPTRWLAQGSVLMFAIACALIGAVTGVALARLASSQPLSRRRVLAACIAEGIFKAALYASVGLGVDSAVNAV